MSDAVPALRRCDPVLSRVIDVVGPLEWEERRRGRPHDAYGSLVRSIIGQQLSISAAMAVFGRLAALFAGRTPTPPEILAADHDALAAIGLSRAKIGYLRDLATRVVDGGLDLQHLGELSDEDVSAQLTAVKGIGQWTADMFLMLHLGRIDVLPVGDLGIRRAVQEAYGLEAPPTPESLREIAQPWRPYRSVASLFLWRTRDNQP